MLEPGTENEAGVISRVRRRARIWPCVAGRFIVDYVPLGGLGRGRRCGSCSLMSKSDGMERQTYNRVARARSQFNIWAVRSRSVWRHTDTVTWVGRRGAFNTS